MKRLQVNERTVRILMAAKGIPDTEELGKRAGFSGQTIRNLFEGKEFRSSTLKGLADALDVNPLDLLEVDGYPAPHLGAPAIVTTN